MHGQLWCSLLIESCDLYSDYLLSPCVCMRVRGVCARVVCVCVCVLIVNTFLLQESERASESTGGQAVAHHQHLHA